MEALCKIRNLYQEIAAFELQFQSAFQLSLNEGMALCSLKNEECLSSGQLAALLALSFSNTSKVIKSLEEKELIERCIDKEDKRKMLFVNTTKGLQKLEQIVNTNIVLPEALANAIK